MLLSFLNLFVTATESPQEPYIWGKTGNTYHLIFRSDDIRLHEHKRLNSRIKRNRKKFIYPILFQSKSPSLVTPPTNYPNNIYTYKLIDKHTRSKNMLDNSLKDRYNKRDAYREKRIFLMIKTESGS